MFEQQLRNSHPGRTGSNKFRDGLGESDLLTAYFDGHGAFVSPMIYLERIDPKTKKENRQLLDPKKNAYFLYSLLYEIESHQLPKFFVRPSSSPVLLVIR